MKIQIVLTIFLLIVPGLVYGAAESMQTELQQSFDLENLPDPAFESFIQSLPYQTLISLRSTSRTFRNKLRDPKFADLLPTKLIEYWAGPLVFIGMAPENPKKRTELVTEPHFTRFIKFSPKGGYIATGHSSNKFLLWQLQPPSPMITQNMRVIGTKAITSKVLKIRTLANLFGAIDVDGTSPIDFSPDGKILAGSFDDIYLWDVPSGKHKHTYKNKEGIGEIAFSPKGHLLAYHNFYCVTLINLEKNKVIKEIESSIPPYFAFSSNGSMLACTRRSEDHFFSDTVALWSIADNNIEKIGDFKNEAEIESIVFSPDCTTLAIGLENGSVNMWNIKIGPDGKLTGTDKPFTALPGLDGPARYVAFSRSGAILATASFKGDNKIILWDVRTGQQITALKGHGPIAFSPDGLLLAAQGLDGYMGLWQLAEKLTE